MFPTALAVLLLSSGAWAQGPTDQDRKAARALGDEGNALLDRGDYEQALDRFTRALAIVDAPTLGVRQAECLERLGRWVEAWDRYSAIARLRLGSDAAPAFVKAAQTAKDRAAALDKRIPRLVVEVEGNDLEGATLTLDGRTVARALWGVEQRVDPGLRQLRLVSGDRLALDAVTMQEGDERRVALEFNGESAARRHEPELPPSGSASRTWGWGAVGVGAASALVGGVLWGMAKSRGDELKEDGCVAGSCPAHLSDELDDYERLRTGSYVGIGVGAVGLVGGTALLLLSGDEPQETRTGVAPWVGVGQAGFSGRF
jgi:hypothetical protein